MTRFNTELNIKYKLFIIYKYTIGYIGHQTPRIAKSNFDYHISIKAHPKIKRTKICTLTLDIFV